ncbi:hypothetical protein GE061_002965 [Apolygus lucorum]|uniref:PLAT domain-containing protein n=1 Tax=Apolygus lucorum TaxID=248454 RepID=A0A8S9X0R8_APOLU|nr:hypothetical protein GE061_002965 [Apolygus lucorum]
MMVWKRTPSFRKLRGLEIQLASARSSVPLSEDTDGTTTPVFCNILGAPLADYRAFVARIFDENVKEDPCYCEKIGSIFYSKDSITEACSRIPDVCKTLSKDEVCQKAGMICDGSQWSTFHCICTEGLQGQLCTIPLSAGNVVKTPILVHYVHAPLFQLQLDSRTPVLPGLHFVTESLGDDFSLVVGFDDGRTIQVKPSAFLRKDYRGECLIDIRLKIHYISEYYCSLIPAGKVYGYGIFLDKMLRINLASPDNLFPTNQSYPLKSAGRFANVNIQARNKGVVTWEWESFRVFVPYQKHFIVGSRYLRIQGCGENRDSAPMKSVDETIKLKASFDLWPWISSDTQIFIVLDHRWYLEDISDPKKLDDAIPTPQLSEKYSLGKEGSTKIIPRGELSGGKYLVVYDFMQKLLNHTTVDNVFVSRKLCYFDLLEDLSLKVYLHTRSRSVPCEQSFNIEVKNYNSRYYDNERLSITWTCEGSTTSECNVQYTKGIQPFSVTLKCGVEYKFTAKVTHPESTEYRIYQVLIKSENPEVVVEIQCIESCGYKVNPDQFLYLLATEKPSISTSWIWDIRQVTRNPNTGEEDVGNDQVASLRQENTEANIFIVPPNKLTSGKEYRITARTPKAYSSYTIFTNEPPKNGQCTFDPPSGVSLETEFRIVCKGWIDNDVPLTYRVLEIPDRTRPEVEPLACSESPVIEELKLRRKDITVMIFDSLNLLTMYNLTLSLTNSAKTINENLVKEYLKNISIKLEGGAMLHALKTIDEVTKMIQDQNLQISEDISLGLLDSLAQIDKSDFEVCDLEKAINVLHRILILKNPEPKHQVDRLVLEASRLLKTYLGVAHTLSKKNELNSHFDKELLSSSITKTACQILLSKDPVLQDDTVPEQDQEEHQYRMIKARDNTLHLMASLGSLLTKYLRYQMKKYVLQRDCFNILTKFGNASQIRDELKIIDLPDEYYKNSSANLAVIDFEENVLWGVPNEVGLIGVIAEVFKKSPDTKGPVDFILKIPNYHARNKSVSGESQALPICSTSEKLDKSFSIHRFTLPDGEGVVVINFPEALVGKVKLFAQQSFKPGYEDVLACPTLNSTEVLVKFSNRNHGTEASFYIASVATNKSSGKIDYDFTYRILRCSIYTGGQFISRGCTFVNLTFHDRQKDPEVHCKCNLSSDDSTSITWFSVDIITPPQHLVLANDIYLFSQVLENYYTAGLVAIVVGALIVTLLWGYRLDRHDERCRKVIVMEDNYPGDNHAYVVAVITGQGIGSGTSSRVAIRVFGDEGYSRVHMLEHSERKTLLSGRDDWFLMTTEKRLGRLTKIQMWHNHVGISPEWYCKKVSVFDLVSHVKYDFIIERWFTFDVRVSLEDARMYEGPAATEMEVSKKWYFLVGGWIFSEMREKHHVASIFRRHPRSFYTRCQRVIISVTFITTTMLVSLMFFRLDEVGPADWPVIPFKLQDVWTGIKSSIISSLITSAVVICFGFHKKYEATSMAKAPKFEVTESEGNDQQQTEEVTTKRGFLAKLRLATYRRIYLKIIKPVQYRPVVFGVKQTEEKKLSLVFLCAGWILASITIAITSFFVVLYGLKFGPKKSLVWGLTFLTGTFSNGIVFAPLRMAIVGLVVALTFKKSFFDMYTMQIQIDYSKLIQKNYMERLKMNYHLRLNWDYKPCKTVVLEKLRSQKFRGREFRYLVTHSVMVTTMYAVVILLATLLGVREGYYHIRQLTEVFAEGKLEGNAHRVWNNISMFKFFSKTPIPALHQVKWYNNKTLKVERSERRADPNSPRFQSQVKGFVKDYTNKLVGVPRLRQLRILDTRYNKKKIARILSRYYQYPGRGHYNRFDVDKNNYLPSWVPYNGYHGFLQQAWAYYTSEMTKTGTTYGYSWIQYSGGGHVIPLSWNLGYSLRRMKFLELSSWVTNRTRCIFLEINVYNNNMKHFSVMRFVIETLPSGIYWNRPQMDVATMHLAGRPKSQAVLLLVTILLVLLVSYSILCIWHSSRDGLLAYLSTWRGLSDLLLISVGLLTVSSQYNRALHFALITDYLDKEPRDKYTSLFSPLKTKGQASDIFCSFCGFLMFNMSCTLFKFKMFEGLHRVFARVYKVGIAAFFILNTYAILIGIHSIMHNTELGNLFVLQFTFKEEIFHTFNQESKVLYILFTPIIYALFKFHIGYLGKNKLNKTVDFHKIKYLYLNLIEIPIHKTQ